MLDEQLAALGIWFTPYAWAGHVLLGLAIQVALALPLRWADVRAAWWLAAAVSIGFWWGREKMEFEFALKAAAHLRTVGPFWYRGWLPFEWDVASQFQLYMPAAANLVAAVIMRTRRPPPRVIFTEVTPYPPRRSPPGPNRAS
jgi:hypothetical protein